MMRMRTWIIAVFYVGLSIFQVEVQGRTTQYKDLGNGTVAFDTCISSDYYVDEMYDNAPNQCFHGKLPNITADEKDKRNCCGFNGIQMFSECDGTDAKNNKITVANVPFCQYADIKDGKMTEKIQLECKTGCKIVPLKDIIDKNTKKEFKIIDHETITIRGKTYPDGYCLIHHCPDVADGWNTDAEVCDCDFEKFIEEKTKPFIAKLKSTGENVQSCCSDRTPIELLDHGNAINDCPNNPKCKEFETLEIHSDNDLNKVINEMNQKVKANSSSCLGVTVEGKYVYAKCKVPCQGKKPCLGRCCKLGESWNEDKGSCQEDKSPADLSDLFQEKIKYPEFSEKQKYVGIRKHLYSENKCKETKVSISHGKLHYTNKSSAKETIYNQDEFCYSEILGGKKQDGLKGRIIFFVKRNKDQSANETHEAKSGIDGVDKELAYTVILAFSTILLFITIFIYVTHTALWKHYSKLMVNFAASLFVANILLLMIWRGGMKENCAPLGLALQFFFLATFTWMTIMSFEIFIQLKSSSLVNHGNDHKRIAKQACIGYGFPLFMIIVTGIVEASAPICAGYRPRFGIGSCGTFYGDEDKFLWLYGPILVMLLLNTGMMIYIFTSVYRQKSRSDGHGANRSQKMDMICLYLRLFLGMGFIWYFEILSWALNPKDDAWILTDFLNMMQGTYVFFIFVCKRNVLGVVFGKKSRLYSTVHQASIKLNRGKSVNMAQGSLTTDQSEISQSLVTDKVSIQLNPSP